MNRQSPPNITFHIVCPPRATVSHPLLISYSVKLSQGVEACLYLKVSNTTDKILLWVTGGKDIPCPILVEATDSIGAQFLGKIPKTPSRRVAQNVYTTRVLFCKTSSVFIRKSFLQCFTCYFFLGGALKDLGTFSKCP